MSNKSIYSSLAEIFRILPRWIKTHPATWPRRSFAYRIYQCKPSISNCTTFDRNHNLKEYPSNILSRHGGKVPILRFSEYVFSWIQCSSNHKRGKCKIRNVVFCFVTYICIKFHSFFFWNSSLLKPWSTFRLSPSFTVFQRCVSLNQSQ